MTTPTTQHDWLEDVQEAYVSACKRHLEGTSAISNRHELFKTSASVAAERRGIVDPHLIQEMNDYVIRQVEIDLSNGGQLSDYKFHFAISYIHAHTPAGTIEEVEADGVMEYINSHWDLFNNEMA